MATATIDGIATHYETTGSGPPLLMFSPGGFDATKDKWRTLGVYRRTNIFEHLTSEYTCIAFDRRESGLSGGRVERLRWEHLAEQGLGLLDHLGIESAAVMGGCVGCSAALQLAVAHPRRVRRMVLYSPAGGVNYRLRQQSRLTRHAAFAAQHGLAGVVELVKESTLSFTDVPDVGPWASVIRADEAFARSYAQFSGERYQTVVLGMARLLFGRDTVPGPDPEDLLEVEKLALIVPGDDASHAMSAARYLQECLPHARYVDVAAADQTEETVPAAVLGFLAEASPC